MESAGKNKKPTFARNLVARREAMGFSSAEAFSEFAEMPYPTIRDIEAGVSGGSRATKEKIARALKCTVDDLNSPPGRSDPLPEWAQVIVNKLEGLEALLAAGPVSAGRLTDDDIENYRRLKKAEQYESLKKAKDQNVGRKIMSQGLTPKELNLLALFRAAGPALHRPILDHIQYMIDKAKARSSR